MPLVWGQWRIVRLCHHAQQGRKQQRGSGGIITRVAAAALLLLHRLPSMQSMRWYRSKAATACGRWRQGGHSIVLLCSLLRLLRLLCLLHLLHLLRPVCQQPFQQRDQALLAGLLGRHGSWPDEGRGCDTRGWLEWQGLGCGCRLLLRSSAASVSSSGCGLPSRCRPKVRLEQLNQLRR